jgi:ubiquinone biosynthesis protein
VLIGSLERLRALPRLAEIMKVLLHHGLHDFIHSAGLHRLVDEASGLVGWKADPAIAALPMPERVRMTLEALGPAFVKLGQVLASRVDLLGPDWIASLDRLHDRASKVPFELLEARFVDDLGAPIAERFAAFEREACAAGSIAQVHRARLADGTDVAVKIRRPGVAEVIEADLLLLAALAQWWEESEPKARRWQPAGIVRQLRKSLAREVDFAAEARSQGRFAESFRDVPEVSIPRVHAQFTRPSLLVMDWVDGIPATDLEALDRAGADRALLAARGADTILKMVLEDGFFHADPHPGNVFFLPGNRIALIDFGMVGWLSTRRREELVDLLAAVVARDAESMRDVLLGWADGHRVSAEHIAEDLGRLLHVYRHAQLREVNLGTLLSEIASVMREHSLMLPADLALLFKALITLEGLGARLVPRFQLVDHVAPYVQRVLMERWTPRQLAARASGSARELGRALRAAPRLVESLSRRLADDGVAIRLEVREIEDFSRHLERSVNRLTIGMVTAALIVGSSILMALSGTQQSFAAWFFGAIGVATALVNSLWLINTIRRSNR